jgi:hypothetical protein
MADKCKLAAHQQDGIFIMPRLPWVFKHCNVDVLIRLNNFRKKINVCKI